MMVGTIRGFCWAFFCPAFWGECVCMRMCVCVCEGTLYVPAGSCSSTLRSWSLSWRLPSHSLSQAVSRWGNSLIESHVGSGPASVWLCPCVALGGSKQCVWISSRTLQSLMVVWSSTRTMSMSSITSLALTLGQLNICACMHAMAHTLYTVLQCWSKSGLLLPQVQRKQYSSTSHAQHCPAEALP